MLSVLKPIHKRKPYTIPHFKLKYPTLSSSTLVTPCQEVTSKASGDIHSFLTDTVNFLQQPVKEETPDRRLNFYKNNSWKSQSSTPSNLRAINQDVFTSWGLEVRDNASPTNTFRRHQPLMQSPSPISSSCIPPKDEVKERKNFQERERRSQLSSSLDQLRDLLYFVEDSKKVDLAPLVSCS